MIKISPCNKIDYKALIKIEKNNFRDPILKNEFESIEKQASHKIWKIEKKMIIGFVYFFHVKDEIEIIQICIQKKYQGKKYGSILINEIKKLKIKKIFLEVSIDNISAVNFYLKNGFQRIGVRKGYYTSQKNSKIDALRLCFELKKMKHS